jgi:hypothetical protein
VINVFSYGYTRLKTEATGGDGYAVSFTIANMNAFPRASSRIAPTHNFVDDITWDKGRHTIQPGTNIRTVVNDRVNANNYPSYSFSRNTLKGLGADIVDSVTGAARAKYGHSARRDQPGSCTREHPADGSTLRTGTPSPLAGRGVRWRNTGAAICLAVSGSGSLTKTHDRRCFWPSTPTTMRQISTGRWTAA